MKVTFSHQGSFKNTERFLKKMEKLRIQPILEKYGQEGVNALRNATPQDSGRAAGSWRYKTYQNPRACGIGFYNDDVENGFPVAIMIQYGHARRGGGFVQGRDYINPALRPIFDKIAQDVWKEVTSA